MHSTPDIEGRRTALARARRLTAELIELVGDLRATITRDERQDLPAEPSASREAGRLRAGDLRAAMTRAHRRPTRQVPHLFG